MSNGKLDAMRNEKVSLVQKLQRRLSLPHHGRARTEKLSRSQSGYRYDRVDRVEHPRYEHSEIHHYPVHPDTDFPHSQRQKARRHTHHSVSSRPGLISTSDHDDVFIKTNSTDFQRAPLVKEKVVEAEDDEKPSFRTLQSEDNRRPSVTVYQLEDSDHPDVKSIQQMVSNMTFCESNNL